MNPNSFRVFSLPLHSPWCKNQQLLISMLLNSLWQFILVDRLQNAHKQCMNAQFGAFIGQVHVSGPQCTKDASKCPLFGLQSTWKRAYITWPNWCYPPLSGPCMGGPEDAIAKWTPSVSREGVSLLSSKPVFCQVSLRSSETQRGPVTPGSNGCLLHWLLAGTESAQTAN